ncbi:Zn-dependent alcohol dehydrogenase [Pseudonocardia ailaonensis]|uniref:Zn-dependent alcohol dehydrogenase n=1 Tax=Pseudonocardia ailaonensis TaxID=367279 RepID=A0ABN2MVS5_9PSEU
MRMAAAGLCHSDLNALEGRTTPAGWPLIPGHEGYGTVEWAGADATSVRVGDRVLFTFVGSCQACYWCLRGEQHLCTSFRTAPTPKGHRGDTPVYGHAGLGAFAEQALVDHRSLVTIDSDLPASQLALISCGVATGASAVERCANLDAAGSIAVLGCGGVGQAAIQAARILGATTIVALDPSPSRREYGLTFGATHAFDPLDPATAAAVKDLTGGRGVDSVIEAVGRQSVAQNGFEILRRGGTMVLIGSSGPGETAGWSIYEQMVDAKRVVGSLYGNAHPRRDFARLAALAESGSLDLASMVSAELPLDRINDAVSALHHGEGLRTVLVF